MASWITHLIIADKVMDSFQMLDRRGFCVGNIAPDCNVENSDWTKFTPSREVTHWMKTGRKTMSDCDGFYREYICRRMDEIKSVEQYSFLLGYYAHIITDAYFQVVLRNEERVRSLWKRIYSDSKMRERAKGYIEDFDSFKAIMSFGERIHEIYSLEAEYLRDNPKYSYFTEIMKLKSFPDYIDYMPKGCITRKIKVMGYIPKVDESLENPIYFSRNEFTSFVNNAALKVMDKFLEYKLTDNVDIW